MEHTEKARSKALSDKNNTKKQIEEIENKLERGTSKNNPVARLSLVIEKEKLREQVMKEAEIARRDARIEDARNNSLKQAEREREAQARAIAAIEEKRASIST